MWGGNCPEEAPIAHERTVTLHAGLRSTIPFSRRIMVTKCPTSLGLVHQQPHISSTQGHTTLVLADVTSAGPEKHHGPYQPLENSLGHAGHRQIDGGRCGSLLQAELGVEPTTQELTGIRILRTDYTVNPCPAPLPHRLYPQAMAESLPSAMSRSDRGPSRSAPTMAARSPQQHWN